MIEKGIHLGGAITSGLVIPVMKSGENQINTNFYENLIFELKKIGGQITYQNNSGWFNPELTKIALDKMMKDAKEKGIDVKTFDDDFLNNLVNSSSKDEINKILNPNLAKTEKSPLSKPFSTNKDNLGGTKSNKPSVRDTLKEIKEKQKKDLGKGDRINEKNKRTKTSKQKNTSIKKSKPKNKVR